MTQNNQGHQSVLRWHIADSVPFQQSLEASIEKYYRLEEMGTKYACTAAWYMAPGGVDPYAPVPVSERHDYYDVPPLVAGGFKVLNQPRGNVSTQGLAGYGANKWQDDDQLWWTGARPDDRLELLVPVEKDGTYNVAVRLTKARDYGIVQFYLDGQKIGDAIDLYHPEVVPTEPISLGTHTLRCRRSHARRRDRWRQRKGRQAVHVWIGPSRRSADSVVHIDRRARDCLVRRDVRRQCGWQPDSSPQHQGVTSWRPHSFRWVWH